MWNLQVFFVTQPSPCYPKTKKNSIFDRVGIKGSWFVSHKSISWSHNQKCVKLPFWLIKDWSKKRFSKIHKKTPMLESDFNNEPAALLKKRLWHRCLSVNFAKSSRTATL